MVIVDFSSVRVVGLWKINIGKQALLNVIIGGRVSPWSGWQDGPVGDIG
jgi:hypothetical protein